MTMLKYRNSSQCTRRIAAIMIIAVASALAASCDESPASSDGAAVSASPVQDAAAPRSGAGGAGIPTVRLTPAFPKLAFNRPVFITHAGDGSNRLFVVEQRGRIRVFENRNDAAEAGVFLDISPKVRMQHNEEGLLSLVFHPKFAENGQFFVYYSASNPKRNVIARYQVSADDPNQADANSEQIILEVEQPYGNHNGSTLLFGPDGFLYASFGDGGLANDPHGNGQNLGTLLGSIIRIDVDRAEGDRAYAIPSDNPFVNRSGARPEIWAYGLRNVWRMSFDRDTGDLWAGDVGQNKWEEIDLIVKGGNYGWDIREGAHAFETARAQPADPLIDPVAEYSHEQGLSVTGGYVYRGKRHERLRGVYLYGDYASGRIWGLRYDDGRVTASREVFDGGRPRRFIASFGEDGDGELYICAFDRMDGNRGRLFRVDAN